MSHRTVALTVPTGHNVANLMRSRFLDEILAADIRLLVLSPFAEDQAFLEEFAHPQITHALLTPWVPTSLRYAIDSILGEQFMRQSGLTAVRLQLDRARRLDPWAGRRLLAVAKDVVSRLPVSRAPWFAVERRLSLSSEIRALFDRFRPRVVVTSTAGFFSSEIPVMAEGRRRGLRVLGIDNGWDNLSSKFHTIRPVDHLAVWNDGMREEAIRYHGLAAEQVTVTGTPQLDVYFDGSSRGCREAFARAIGVRPETAIITLATAPAIVYDSTPLVVDTLAQALERGAFGADVHLLVRVHPRDKIERYAPWAEAPRVTVEKPMARVQSARGADVFDAVAPTFDERRHLADTLAYSAVIVNFASTTALEACLFDTPVVNIGFDATPNLPLPLSIQRYFAYEHYQVMHASGAVRIAGSPEQLISHVQRYLADRSLDCDARRRAAAELYPHRDGQSALRLARLVIDAVDEPQAVKR